MEVLQIKSKNILSTNKKETLKKFLVSALGYTEQKAVKIMNNCPVIININISYLTDKDKKEFLNSCLFSASLLGINPEFICVADINVYEIPYRHQYVPEINMNDIAHINSIYIIPEQIMENIFLLLKKNAKDRKDKAKISDIIGDLESTINKLSSIRNILKDINN